MNRIALVSGATSGIGLSIVNMLVGEGIYTILLGRNKNKMHDICQRFGETHTEGFCCDLIDTEQVTSCVDEIVAKYKNIDILINCAGIGRFDSLESMSIQDLKESIDTNLVGTIILTKLVAANMTRNKTGQIINIESIASTKGFAYGAAYVASKFGLAGFSQVLWEEMKKYEVKVCSIRPGLVNTDLFRDMKETYDLEYALDPSDIAYLVETVINQSDKSNISEIVVRPIKRQAQNLFNELVRGEVENRKTINLPEEIIS